MQVFFITFIIVLLTSIPALADKEYTPAELNQMISSGNYPDQGDPVTQTSSTSFESCINRIDNVLSQIEDYYPVQTVVETNIMVMRKAWVNDSAMTLTCSKPDRKLVITSSPYK